MYRHLSFPVLLTEAPDCSVITRRGRSIFAGLRAIAAVGVRAAAVLGLAAGISTAHAALLKFDISAQNNSGDAILNMIVPDGGIVTFSLVADVPDGLPLDVEAFSATNCGISWDNGGPQTFSFTTSGRGLTSASGLVDVIGNGPNLTFGGATL